MNTAGTPRASVNFVSLTTTVCDEIATSTSSTCIVRRLLMFQKIENTISFKYWYFSSPV